MYVERFLYPNPDEVTSQGFWYKKRYNLNDDDAPPVGRARRPGNPAGAAAHPRGFPQWHEMLLLVRRVARRPLLGARRLSGDFLEELPVGVDALGHGVEEGLVGFGALDWQMAKE